MDWMESAILWTNFPRLQPRPCANRGAMGGRTDLGFLPPLLCKRLIKHSAGLWPLTRTNSASCWQVTHTEAAVIGCLTLGGTPLIVCLAYFFPSDGTYSLLSLLRDTVQGEQKVWVRGVCVRVRWRTTSVHYSGKKPNVAFLAHYCPRLLSSPPSFLAQHRSDRMSPLQTAAS